MPALSHRRAARTLMSKSSPKKDEMSFEDAMRRLDELVTGIDSNQIPLADMITSYEEGVQLLKICRQHLDTARRRVELINCDLEDGKATLTPFEESTAAEAPAPSPPAAKSAPTPRSSRSKSTDSDSGEIRFF